MDCVSQLSALIPVAESLMPASKTSLDGFAWKAYLAKDLKKNLTRISDSATLDAVRHSLDFCGEWDSICEDPSQMFAAPHNLAICSLYPEITTTANTVSSRIPSAISTCLISYCALAPLCSTDTTTNCSVSSLITSDGSLSSDGVGRCWSEICDTFPLSPNSDIAGVGVSHYHGHLGSDLVLTTLAYNIIFYADTDCIIGFFGPRYLQSASCLSTREEFGSEKRPEPGK